MRWVILGGMLFCLPGCAAAVMGVEVASGVMEVLKDGFDIKLDLKNGQVVTNSSQPVVTSPAIPPAPAPVFAPIVPN